MNPVPPTMSTVGLTRALGMEGVVRASVTSHNMVPGDKYLLCSDGLTDGLTELEEEDTDNGNNVGLEPPDQALAVGNGFVVEDVNDAFSVYDQNGKPLVAAIANNKFFGFASAAVQPNGPFGPSLADPRAYFDSYRSTQ